MWIALKFFVLLQSKQLHLPIFERKRCCELLSNFLYFCSRNNIIKKLWSNYKLWIALKFFVLLQSKQLGGLCSTCVCVVNCSQIFCTFAVETTNNFYVSGKSQLWIALKFFVLLQSKQHIICLVYIYIVVNCSQIFCTFAVETTIIYYFYTKYKLWIALKFFVLLQSKQQELRKEYEEIELWIALKFFVLLQSKQLFVQY